MTMLRFLVRRVLGDARFARLKQHQLHARAHPRIAIALARAATTSALRQLDPVLPPTWEFTGFSQNGEDGIIDYLCDRLLRPNRYFVEIGASNGLENNTTWLAMARRYGGLMIDGDPSKVAECSQTFGTLNGALEFASMMVNRESGEEIERLALFRNPDVFSLDIDSLDYYVAAALLDRGFRPKIFIVEYNSAFGPERSVTIPYQEPFNRHHAHPSGYYYGVSVTGLRYLFERHGYRFITVEQNGVNAFFADPLEFDAVFLERIRGTAYRENIAQRRESRTDWAGQFEQIRHLPLVEIGPSPALALGIAQP
jgi:hypothetical protein